jgi:hypothetical protein
MGPGSGPGANALWPLKAGNTWIYQDSVFTDSSLLNSYPDTITIGTKTISDPSDGLLFYALNDANQYGWFTTGSYIAVDGYNTTIYEYDSLSTSPYIFFQTSNMDGAVVGTGYDNSNLNCPSSSTQYGYATESVVAGYTCVKNVEYTTNCNNITTEAVVTYVSPSVGIVRIEDYAADSTHNNNLFLDYSQTLKSFNLVH